MPPQLPPEAPPPQQDEGLYNQVQKLTDEVESLREERAAPPEVTPPPPAAPSSAEEEKPLPTVLVYRDGHQGEVENYAILGETMWVFSGRATKRIALADLDLEATAKVNDERGVEFYTPGER